ncbi:hypothetical protein E2562_029212 [Oryza meyeriana var. granulata]|uniref:Uncharacterized protein n=1 Tax=Oryza meyeriana var. granulata TaxID=110450 RepID=A0A6G1EQS7_9ORYZ|nr:hypothetical protein E2562_029212 [Oryza meyeriana var. granulata]
MPNSDFSTGNALLSTLAQARLIPDMERRQFVEIYACKIGLIGDASQVFDEIQDNTVVMFITRAAPLQDGWGMQSVYLS